MRRFGSFVSLAAIGLNMLGASRAADRDFRLCDGKRATIIARYNDLTVQGTGKADVIVGTNGVDEIYGNGGNDRICGLDGADRLFGDGNDDRLFGGGDFDDLDGGPGNDLLHGGARNGAALFTDADTGVVVDLAQGTATSGAEGDTLKNIQDVVGSKFKDTVLGDGKPNQLVGRDGDDVLRGRGGSDEMAGESGADLLEGGEDEDSVSGGDGSDVASYRSSSKGIIGDIEQQEVDEARDGSYVEQLDSIEGLVGSPHIDVLHGDDGNNNLSGLAGGDALLSGPGLDRLDGGEGSDTLEGYAGDDLIIGGPNDPVTAHGPVAKLDDLRYISGDIVVYDEYNGALTADLDEGVARTDAGETDVLEGIESILGSFGTSDVSGDDGPNVLIGWANTDAFKGEGGNDALYGFAGDDALVGGLGDDYLEGGGGDDLLVPGRGPRRPAFVGSDNDIVNGGPHSTITGDTINYFDAPAGVNVNLQSGTASGEGSDTISGIELISGSAFNDTLTGNDLTNFLLGGGGNDTLNAGGGNDEIDGGSGTDDSADGGEGGEGPSELPKEGDNCINVETHVNCEHVDGVPQDQRSSTFLSSWVAHRYPPHPRDTGGFTPSTRREAQFVFAVVAALGSLSDVQAPRPNQEADS